MNSAIAALIGMTLAIVLIVRKVQPVFALFLGALAGGLLAGWGMVRTVAEMIAGVKEIVPAGWDRSHCGHNKGIVHHDGYCLRPWRMERWRRVARPHSRHSDVCCNRIHNRRSYYCIGIVFRGYSRLRGESCLGSGNGEFRGDGVGSPPPRFIFQCHRRLCSNDRIGTDATDSV